MQTSNDLDKIAPALVKAQSELKHAVKDSENAGFKSGGKASRYADLSSVWDAAKPVLTANKLAALQDVVSNEDGMGVRTRLLHESGQWIEFDPPMIPLAKKDAHGAGSVLTYGRRYSLSAALGVVADEDDDGNAAVQQTPAARVADAQPQRQADMPDPTKVKNGPGISEAKNWVREHIRTLNGCGNPEELMEAIEAVKPRYIKVCGLFPNLWTGPDGTGLRGEAQKMATAYECRPDFDKFIKTVEAAAVALSQPQAAE